MKKIIALLLSVAFSWSLVQAGISTVDWDSSNPFLPAEVDSGGPDAFGYRWKASTEPGGPTFGWIDISTIGTEITGLGDDNYVGPFPIGFSFRFYWYDVSQYWVGSNGYLKFGSGYNMAQPFPASIPLTAVPNDFLALLIADWYPGVPAGTGHAYRWNNADSLIVSFVNLHPWVGPGVIDGTHSFQVIMSRLDSSITYQYGEQQGTVSNNDMLVGIECVSGQVGLEHSHDLMASRNTAVQFYYPDVVTYQVHDLAAQASSNPASEGFFLQVGEEFTPWARVKNTGNQPETSYQVQFRIFQAPPGIVVYNQTMNSGAISPGEEQDFTFSTTWTPTIAAQYLMRTTVILTGDLNPANDNKQTECHALVLPGTMLYDDGISDQGWSWQGGDGGVGQKFIPPTYPVRIDCVRYFSAGAPVSPFTVQVLDDDDGGAPGTILYSQSVQPAASGFVGVNLIAQNIVINDGAFYLAWIQADSNTAPIGTDTTSNNQMGSRQSWEYTGVWSPFRNAETSDFIIRAKISEVGGPNLPPEIVDYFPTSLDTVFLDEAVDFGVTATDPNGDPLSYVWKLDDAVQGTNATQTIVFSQLGDHVVGVWVSDGELADSMFWDVTVVASGVDPIQGTMPTVYALESPHPNPFNPITTLALSLPQAGIVQLWVYDVRGQVVARLANGWMSAGNYHLGFDASGLAGGVYFAKMTAGDFSFVRKMVLLK